MKHKDATLIIDTQYLENYGCDKKPHWKVKMGHEFSIQVNSDDWLYGETEVKAWINHQIETKHNSDYQKYIPVNYQIKFEESTKLDVFEPETITQKYPDYEGLSKNLIPEIATLSKNALYHFAENFNEFSDNLTDNQCEVLRNEFRALQHEIF